MAPVLVPRNADVGEGESISASPMVLIFDLLPVSWYAVEYTGTGNGYFELGSTIEPEGQWFYVNASQMSGLKYVGGTSAGSESIHIKAEDLTGWSSIASLTATTHVTPVVNGNSVSVAENGSVAGSTLLSVSGNTDGDSITEYGFWDDGSGSGYLQLGTAIEPGKTWFVVGASDLSNLNYIAGASAGNDTILVDAFDASVGSWLADKSLTATTTAPATGLPKDVATAEKLITAQVPTGLKVSSVEDIAAFHLSGDSTDATLAAAIARDIEPADSYTINTAGFINPIPLDINDENQCAVLVQALYPFVGLTKNWTNGSEQVDLSGTFNSRLSPGTPIATFTSASQQGPLLIGTGKYPSSGEHAGIFLGYGMEAAESGFFVLDQYDTVVGSASQNFSNYEPAEVRFIGFLSDRHASDYYELLYYDQPSLLQKPV